MFSVYKEFSAWLSVLFWTGSTSNRTECKSLGSSHKVSRSVLPFRLPLSAHFLLPHPRVPLPVQPTHTPLNPQWLPAHAPKRTDKFASCLSSAESAYYFGHKQLFLQ